MIDKKFGGNVEWHVQWRWRYEKW